MDRLNEVVYILVFTITFLSSDFLAAQRSDSTFIDSLSRVYHDDNTSDSLRLEILYYFMNRYSSEDQDTALVMGQKALELARARKDTLYMGAIYEFLGIMNSYKGNNQLALEYELEALRLFERIKYEYGVATIWNNLGESYYEMDLFNEAFDYYNRSLNKSVELNDSLGQAVAMYNVGRVLKKMGQLEKARDFIEESMQLSEVIEDTEGIAYSLHDLGDILIITEDYDKAMTNLNRALQICDSLNIYILAPQVLNKIATIHRKEGQFNEALNKHDEALAYYERLGNESGRAETYLGIGKTYMRMGNYAETSNYFNNCIKLAQENNDKGLIIECYEQISELYQLQGNFQKSLEFYKKYKQLEDSLHSEKKSEQFAQLQISYETQKKDIEIALLNEKEKQREEQLKNEEFLRNILVVILAFTGVLLITLYRSSERRKKINELLVEHQKEIEAQSKELEKLVEMKDKFFSIVSHDLRSPINALVGILDMLDEGHLTQEELREVTKSLNIRLNNTRKLLDNLLDWAMIQMNEIKIKEEEIELKKLVEDNLTFFREVNDKKIKFTNEVHEVNVMADRNMLDLIIRNIVSNSIKFTEEGGKVDIGVEDAGADLVVTIIDDGIGMPQDQVDKIFDTAELYTRRGTANEKGTGLGLRLCKEFVERMGGQIWVESEEGVGSKFKFSIKKA